MDLIMNLTGNQVFDYCDNSPWKRLRDIAHDVKCMCGRRVQRLDAVTGKCT